ncbi:MAG: putative Zn-ribbon and HTH transcriptional regulator [Pseudohongiellaceae bacterium]|jgi:predicted Zn-ribbon and HTH transcriptional regulator
MTSGDGADEEAALHTQDSARHGFSCENCGATLRWDPVADALSCDHCETTQAVPRAKGSIVERPLDAAGEAARGFGLELRVARCNECAARVTYDGASVAERCAFCGSASVLAQEANRNGLRPESLLPLDIGRAQAEEAFSKWLGKLWFRPNALKRVRVAEAAGVYVPYWTFDCQVHSDWSADAGYYYYVTETYVTRVNGKSQVQTRQVRKVRWEPAWGARDDHYDDLLVSASAGLSSELLSELGGFDTSELVPYRPEYLAGWQAEEYSVDLEQGWQAGRGLVEDRQFQRCSGDIPGDTSRHLSVDNDVSQILWKHVLLPVWSLAYTYRGKPWPVLINGQSGRVAGKAPLSWVKILGAVVGTAVAVGAAAAFSS